MSSLRLLSSILILVGLLGVFPSPGWTQPPSYIEHPWPERPFIEQLSPPVLQRGTTTRIMLHGKLLQQAIDVWTSHTPGLIQATLVSSPDPSTAIFDLRVSPKTPIGLCGVRLATQGGLSNVHLCLIDDLPVTQLPDAKTPVPPVRPVQLPACLTTRTRDAGVDRFEIQVVAGQAVTFEVVGNRLGKDFDPLVILRTADGSLVAQHDNDPGLFFDCRFRHTFAQTGKHIVEVRDARFEGDPTWHYVLRMGRFPEARVAVPAVVQPGVPASLGFPQEVGLIHEFTVPPRLTTPFHTVELRRPDDQASVWLPALVSSVPPQVESEPNNTQGDATLVSVPGVLCGVLDKSRDIDWFAFDLQQGQRIDVRGLSRILGSPADLELTMFGPDGREARRVDDVGMDEGSFNFTAGKTARHWLSVRDIARSSGPPFAYALEVLEPQPALQISADFSSLTLPRENWQPVPLKITRTGFAGPVELTLLGAPAGVHCEPATIPADANEVVLKISAASSAPLGLATLQIVGTATLPAPKPTAPAANTAANNTAAANATTANTTTANSAPANTTAGNTTAGNTATGNTIAGNTITAIARTQPLPDRQLKNVDRIPYALRDDQRQLPPTLLDRLALFVTPPAPFSVDVPEPLLVMPRYQTAPFAIVTTRRPGANAQSPITFRADGGQIGDEAEERNQVYLRAPAATVAQTTVTGVFHNRILTQLNKNRVDLYATIDHDGHKTTLVRTFSLDIKSTFAPAVEPALISVDPGETVRVQIAAHRLPSYDGSITLEAINPPATIITPATLDLPANAPVVEVPLQISADAKPGRLQLRWTATGFVGKYEESVNVAPLTIEIKKPPATK